MKLHVIAASWLAVAALGISAGQAKPDNEQPIYEISLEVQVLRAFHSLNLNDEQLKQVAKLAKETAAPPGKRNAAKVSDDLRTAVTKLRDALAMADDDDKIGDLEEELDQAMEKEKPQLDDSFDITKAARTRAPEIVKSFGVTQLASYYSAIAEEVHDPLNELTTALVEVRGFDRKEWTDKRDEIADNVAWAVAGLDAAKAEKINDKVIALLSQARSLDDKQFKAKRAELEKEAKALVGNIGADTLLRHYAEHTVADMLSNPRLEAALKARLK